MGQGALHIASLWGNLEAIQALIAAGADINLENARGQVPLTFAANARKNALAVCRLLLAAGAHTDIADLGGNLPYEQAESDQACWLL